MTLCVVLILAENEETRSKLQLALYSLSHPFRTRNTAMKRSQDGQYEQTEREEGKGDVRT